MIKYITLLAICICHTVSTYICMYVILGFPTELTRKHVADMFFHAELEIEARAPGTTRLMTWHFKADSDQEKYIKEVNEQEQSILYSHQQSKNCPMIGKHITLFHYNWFLEC